MINKIFIALIKFYQKYISVLFPSTCRFYPSCSEYARQSFAKFNFFKAFALSVYRVLRCNPWCEGGYDPVPDKKVTKKE